MLSTRATVGRRWSLFVSSRASERLSATMLMNSDEKLLSETIFV